MLLGKDTKTFPEIVETDRIEFQTGPCQWWIVVASFQGQEIQVGIEWHAELWSEAKERQKNDSGKL